MAFSIYVLGLTTACCTRSPNKISPTESVGYFGSDKSRWVLIRINSISEINNHGCKDYLVYRSNKENRWLIKNKGEYVYFKRLWTGKYREYEFETEPPEINYETDSKFFGTCLLEDNIIRYINVDLISSFLPQVEMLVIDDKKRGIILETSNATGWSLSEITSLRMGSGELLKESFQLSELK